MNTNYKWKSKMGPQLEAFIALKQANGFIYETEKYIFSKFDTFCYENSDLDDYKITQKQIASWNIQFPSENVKTMSGRISFIRVFSKYLNSIGIESYVPGLTASTYKPIVYIPTVEELKIFFKTVDNHEYRYPIEVMYRINLNYPILFRILYCCGLRLGECCSIKRELIDFDNASITILKSKGLKDRIVYLPVDLCKKIREFDLKIDSMIPNRVFMFCGKDPSKNLTRGVIANAFRRLWKESFPNAKGNLPSPHSLRHSYICTKVSQWMFENKDINVMMPYVSKYLGHANINETYYYYENSKSVFHLLEKYDKHSMNIIPEVIEYED